MLRYVLLLSSVLWIVSCGPVSSSNFETSELTLRFDVSGNVDAFETIFDISVVRGTSRPVNLVGGDSLIIHHEDQDFTAARISDGNYSVTMPFISTGEYFVELNRPNDISSSDTRVVLNHYPMLVSPSSGESFNRNDVFEAIWEIQTDQGPALSPVYRLEVSRASCQSDLDEVILLLDSEIQSINRPILDGIFPIPSGLLYSRQIEVSEILAELEDRNESGKIIKQCDISLNLSARAGTNVSPNSPNFDLNLEALPVIAFFDPVLSGGSGDAEFRSNTIQITLFAE